MALATIQQVLSAFPDAPAPAPTAQVTAPSSGGRIINRLQAACKASGLTIPEIAAATGLTNDTIEEYVLNRIREGFVKTDSAQGPRFQFVRARPQPRVNRTTHRVPTCLHCGAEYTHHVMRQESVIMLTCRDCSGRTHVAVRTDGYENRLLGSPEAAATGLI